MHAGFVTKMQMLSQHQRLSLNNISALHKVRTLLKVTVFDGDREIILGRKMIKCGLGLNEVADSSISGAKV